MAYDWTEGLTGALSGAGSGAMIGSAVPVVGPALGAGIGALVGLAGGFLDTEPETDWWDNYYKMLNESTGNYRRQARGAIASAADKAQAAQYRSGLTGNIRTGFVRAALPQALNAADMAAQQQAIAAANAGSMTTQNDYSGLWSALGQLGQGFGTMGQNSALTDLYKAQADWYKSKMATTS